MHKRNLDEKRRILNNHEDQQLRLTQSLEVIQNILEQEKKLVEKMPNMAYALSGFAEANKSKQRQFEQLIEEQQIQISSIRDEIQEIFSELKKYFIIMQKYAI